MLEDLVKHMYDGGLVTHSDWSETDYITIKNGEFVDEFGGEFVISPWMLNDLGFNKKEIDDENWTK